VLTGGELPAAVVADAVVRLLPVVLGKEESHLSESFEDNLLEYPQYTRPEEFEGQKVPEVLLSGNHAEIEKWRKAEAEKRTEKRRPDLRS
jgi:tRNA (guanine37-N1)-methyltransferase